MIRISVTKWSKFMILAAILILCKLEGQDVKIIFGIRHFWIQHAQIDWKSHRYRFSPHLYLRCLYFRNRPCLREARFVLLRTNRASLRISQIITLKSVIICDIRKLNALTRLNSNTDSTDFFDSNGKTGDKDLVMVILTLLQNVYWGMAAKKKNVHLMILPNVHLMRL